MASDEERDWTPDEEILKAIFPQSKPAATTTLAKTFDTCTFIAYFDRSEKSGHSNGAVVVRLEIDKNRLRAISALQEIAALAIPALVPAVLQIGTLGTTTGRKIDFSVTEFVADTVTL